MCGRTTAAETLKKLKASPLMKYFLKSSIKTTLKLEQSARKITQLIQVDKTDINLCHKQRDSDSMFLNECSLILSKLGLVPVALSPQLFWLFFFTLTQKEKPPQRACRVWPRMLLHCIYCPILTGNPSLWSQALKHFLASAKREKTVCECEFSGRGWIRLGIMREEEGGWWGLWVKVREKGKRGVWDGW